MGNKKGEEFTIIEYYTHMCSTFVSMAYTSTVYRRHSLRYLSNTRFLLNFNSRPMPIIRIQYRSLFNSFIFITRTEIFYLIRQEETFKEVRCVQDKNIWCY